MKKREHKDDKGKNKIIIMRKENISKAEGYKTHIQRASKSWDYGRHFSMCHLI